MAKGIPDVNLAFRFGAKLTILVATNGVVRVKNLDWCFLCSTDDKIYQKKILRLCFFAWSRFWSRSRSNLVSPPPRLVKIWPGEFMNENLCSIKCKDLARSKSEALVNICILFERNVKACNAEQRRQRKRLKNR